MGDLPHLPCISLHDTQVCTNKVCQISLVHDEQIALGDAWPSFSRNLVASADIDDIDDVVSKLATVICSQVVTARLDEQQFSVELAVQVGEGGEVGGDVFSDGSMGAASCFYGGDSLSRQSIMAGEELAVLAGEDVVCDGGDAVLVTEGETQCKHEGRLARTYRSGERGPGSALVISRWRSHGWWRGHLTYPPMPTVKARSLKSRPWTMGISRPRKDPGPSRISCVWP